MPSWGTDRSTGPLSNALDRIVTAVCGTRAPSVVSPSRPSSSRLNQRTHGSRSLITDGNGLMDVLNPLTGVCATWFAPHSHWLIGLRACAIATNTPSWLRARSRSTPRAWAYGIIPSAYW